MALVCSEVRTQSSRMTGVCEVGRLLFPLFWLCVALGTKENRMGQDRENRQRERRGETMSVSAQPTTVFRLSHTALGAQ